MLSPSWSVLGFQHSCGVLVWLLPLAGLDNVGVLGA
jgi:hypothetical protein